MFWGLNKGLGANFVLILKNKAKIRPSTSLVVVELDGKFRIYLANRKILIPLIVPLV